MIAKLVVAAAPVIIENFAYPDVVVAPTATRSVVVESVTSPTLLVAQPPAADMPDTEMVPQATLPEPSVWSACAPVQDGVLAMPREPTRAFPDTDNTPKLPFVEKRLVVVADVPVAFAKRKLPRMPVPRLKFVPNRFVLDAVVEKKFVLVALVSVVVPVTDSPPESSEVMADEVA